MATEKTTLQFSAMEFGICFVRSKVSERFNSARQTTVRYGGIGPVGWRRGEKSRHIERSVRSFKKCRKRRITRAVFGSTFNPSLAGENMQTKHKLTLRFSFRTNVYFRRGFPLVQLIGRAGDWTRPLQRRQGCNRYYCGRRLPDQSQNSTGRKNRHGRRCRRGQLGLSNQFIYCPA